MDKLKEEGARISKLIYIEGAYVYICGDGNNMAKDVNSALCEILSKYEGLSLASAEDYLKEMKVRQRYLLDIWS
jgi:sulfite reductase (NADPH) flavoprotein alpha-component